MTTIRLDDEEYELIHTLEEFNKWCVKTGFIDEHRFFKATGVHFDEIRGVLFTVVHHRVFTAA